MAEESGESVPPVLIEGVLTEDQERLIESWVWDCAQRGVARRQERILSSVQELRARAGLEVWPSESTAPTQANWYIAFLRRRPLVAAAPDTIDPVRSKQSPDLRDAERCPACWQSRASAHAASAWLHARGMPPGQLLQEASRPSAPLPNVPIALLLRRTRLRLRPDPNHPEVEVPLTVVCAWSLGAGGPAAPLPALVVFPEETAGGEGAPVPDGWMVMRAPGGALPPGAMGSFLRLLRARMSPFAPPLLMLVHPDRLPLTLDVSEAADHAGLVVVPVPQRSKGPAGEDSDPLFKLWSLCANRWTQMRGSAPPLLADVPGLVHMVLSNREVQETQAEGIRESLRVLRDIGSTPLHATSTAWHAIPVLATTLPMPCCSTTLRQFGDTGVQTRSTESGDAHNHFPDIPTASVPTFGQRRATDTSTARATEASTTNVVKQEPLTPQPPGTSSNAPVKQGPPGMSPSVEQGPSYTPPLIESYTPPLIENYCSPNRAGSDPSSSSSKTSSAGSLPAGVRQESRAVSDSSRGTNFLPSSAVTRKVVSSESSRPNGSLSQPRRPSAQDSEPRTHVPKERNAPGPGARVLAEGASQRPAQGCAWGGVAPRGTQTCGYAMQHFAATPGSAVWSPTGSLLPGMLPMYSSVVLQPQSIAVTPQSIAVTLQPSAAPMSARPVGGAPESVSAPNPESEFAATANERSSAPPSPPTPPADASVSYSVFCASLGAGRLQAFRSLRTQSPRARSAALAVLSEDSRALYALWEAFHGVSSTPPPSEVKLLRF